MSPLNSGIRRFHSLRIGGLADAGSMSVIEIFHQPSPAQGLLPLPHVQFRKAENGGRLDRSRRRGHRRDTACLVDATDVRTVNGLKIRPARSTGAIEIVRQLISGGMRPIAQSWPNNSNRRAAKQIAPTSTAH
jgi:hypothetical protein